MSSLRSLFPLKIFKKKKEEKKDVWFETKAPQKKKTPNFKDVFERASRGRRLFRDQNAFFGANVDEEARRRQSSRVFEVSLRRARVSAMRGKFRHVERREESENVSAREQRRLWEKEERQREEEKHRQGGQSRRVHVGGGGGGVEESVFGGEKEEEKRFDEDTGLTEEDNWYCAQERAEEEEEEETDTNTDRKYY